VESQVKGTAVVRWAIQPKTEVQVAVAQARQDPAITQEQGLAERVAQVSQVRYQELLLLMAAAVAVVAMARRVRVVVAVAGRVPQGIVMVLMLRQIQAVAVAVRVIQVVAVEMVAQEVLVSLLSQSRLAQE
jgi:hypothetical protein